MNRQRALRIAAVVMAALSVTGCAGLPTSGPVSIGLAVGEAQSAPDIAQLADGPAVDAEPGEIVLGFLEAAVTPENGWGVARQFLSAELAETWQPATGVTIDETASAREFSSEVGISSAESAEVRVLLSQVATVDSGGSYSSAPGSAEAVFKLELDGEGQWRIAEAADGIVLDADSFEQVYRRHSLQYFDQRWGRLVSDARWYPRRSPIATTITQAVVSGEPTEWLAGAVRSAFPAEVTLARGSVPVDADQVAEVALNDAALSLDATTLARMRTQLEQSLVGAGISQVRFTVDGRSLDAGLATVATSQSETGTFVLTDDAFGAAVGGDVTEVASLSTLIEEITEPIAAIDISSDETMAAVQLTSGRVYFVGDERVDELDERPGLIQPSIDPYNFTWAVAQDDPAGLLAWAPEVTASPIGKAWPGSSQITQLRVSSDGTRVAAVVRRGSEQLVQVASVIRDGVGTPVELGEPETLAAIDAPAHGLAWFGTDSVGILVGEGDTELLTQVVGGPMAAQQTAPSDALSIAGGRTAAGVRILDARGEVYAQRGSAWQRSVSGVLVLGTRAGY